LTGFALRQDPVLADVHLISEPWDAGPGGYQVGRFPGRFMDWNDQFRDTMRGYWLQTGVDRAQFARRFAGSSDLFSPQHKRPWASVNFLSVHDGFTLADVVSYSKKHNYANGEDNRDGRDGELCANFGAEGPSDDPGVLELRRRVQRAMLATLMLAQGTPMLGAGDEFGNSQQGNNNAYCQDNPTGWLDWARADEQLVQWVAQLRQLRNLHPLLSWSDWFTDHANHPNHASMRWFNRHGAPMQVHDWHNHERAGLACLLTAPGAQHSDLLLIFNPQSEDRLFKLPADVHQARLLCDSSGVLSVASVHTAEVTVPYRSLLLFKRL
jgi:isoamylase